MEMAASNTSDIATYMENWHLLCFGALFTKSTVLFS